jgi:hypothetical protein
VSASASIATITGILSTQPSQNGTGPFTPFYEAVDEIRLVSRNEVIDRTIV